MGNYNGEFDDMLRCFRVRHLNRVQRTRTGDTNHCTGGVFATTGRIPIGKHDPQGAGGGGEV